MRLQCCITGRLAEVLTREGKQPDIGDVCLIRFSQIGNYNRVSCIQCIYFYTGVDKPRYQESTNSKTNARFHGDDHSLDMYQHVNDKIRVQEKCKKWSQFPFRTIQEMKRCYKGGNCRVMCYVYAIDTISGWYYFACMVCHNKVFKKSISFDEKDVPSWWCEFCQCGVTKVSARYKLDLLVQDQTVREMLPPDLVEIVGKTYGFGISVDENKKSSEVEKSSAMKVWSLSDNMLKRIKSLHHDSTYSMKKQCTNVIKTDKLENGEVSIDDPIGISIDTPFTPSIDYSVLISIDALLVKLYAQNGFRMRMKLSLLSNNPRASSRLYLGSIDHRMQGFSKKFWTCRYLPRSTRTNKETQLLFSPDPSSLEGSVRKEAHCSSIHNNTCSSLDFVQPPSTQTLVPSTDTRPTPSTEDTHLPSTDIVHPTSIDTPSQTSIDTPSQTSIDTEPRDMVATLILVRDDNGDLHDQEGHLRNAAGDFEVEILMSFGGSHWCRLTPDFEHRSTSASPNQSTGSPEHRPMTPTESTTSCNTVRILTHEEFAVKHPHPPSPDKVRIARRADTSIDQHGECTIARQTEASIDRQPPAPIDRRAPIYLPSADAKDRCCTS
ncbi:hypothetical protein DY000_02006888 [Brassica cretica]|uniref:Replication factor A C-terminal domain-containing protein n=1 Tax=Brassica cretica TaxID=69181 RepID=A0ABQ7CBU3_BRACR|nr:hypothetical protein DY000_02006888 [Brassica cretica]